MERPAKWKVIHDRGVTRIILTEIQTIVVARLEQIRDTFILSKHSPIEADTIDLVERKRRCLNHGVYFAEVHEDKG